jgi:ABC-type lipoprotein export system ATPase subunit
MSDATLVQCNSLSKSFRMSDDRLTILQGADLTVRRGEFVAIEGRSGSGKSTLLHLVGLLDEADSGELRLGGQSIRGMSGADRAKLRNTMIGFVFQFYHLLPELNVMQNTLLPARVSGRRATDTGAADRAAVMLREFGLGDRLKHKPRELSGGERQRVAIARALINQPPLLLADEPTGNLDNQTGRQILDVLESLHARGQTIVMVTHDRALARQADRVLLLQDGRLRPAD